MNAFDLNYVLQRGLKEKWRLVNFNLKAHVNSTK